MRRAPLAAVLLALASLAAAQADNVRLGASVNAYYFTDARLRSALGSPAVTYGVNLTEIGRPSSNGKASFAYDIIAASRDDSTLFVLPLTFGYTKTLADRNASTIPYYRVAAGAAYYDVAIHDGGFDRSFKAVGAVGSVEAGVVFSRTVGLKAKYYLFQNRGIPLSGLQIGLVYNFGKL